jgi:hypothetical protein
MEIHHWILIAVAIIGAIIYFRNKKDDAAAGVVVTPAPAPAPVVQTLAGIWQGRVDMPPQADRIAARDRWLASGGALGGGVDGGIYLDGAFGFETDAVGNVTKGEFILHGTRAPVRGNVTNNSGSFEGGEFHVAKNGKDITGRVFEGGGLEYKYGVIVGIFTANGKL